MAWPVYPHGFLGPGLDEDPYLVERSLRFDGTASLNRTFGAPAFNSFEFVISMWVKVSAFGTARHLFGVGTNHFLGFNATDNLNLTFAGTSLLTTTAVFRDPSAWYHIVWRSQNATGAGQFLYVNNQLVGQGTGATNVNTLFNTAVAHRIGCSNTTTPANFFSGYLAEIIFGDEEGLATPGVFAEADSITGRWRPKPLSSNDAPFFADGNGFYLKFNDTASLTTLGYSSGNTNHWTLNNFSITTGSGDDSLVESPSDYNGNSDSGLGEQVRGNYCTLNPIDRLTTATLSNGALDFTTATTGHNAIGTFAMTTGKWYWEARTTAGTTQARATVHSLTAPSTYYSFAADNTDYGFRFDADAGTLDYTTNGTSWVSLATGLTSGPYFPFFNNNGTTSKTISANFGQRPFTYTAPSEYKVLCTTNLPTPTIRAPDSEMDVLTYAGDGTSKFLNASNFDVGMSWIKNRTTTSNHILTDRLRPEPVAPMIRTNQFMYGSSSGYFNGVDGNYLDSPLASDFFSGDFTVEAWVRVPNKSACTVINTDPHTIFAISLNYLSNQKINIAIGNGSSWLLVPFVASTTFTYNSWFHVAVVRNGGTITIYQDGVNVGSTTTMPSGNTNFLRIGAVTSISGFNNETYSGHIDDLRLVKGSAIYTSNFTPPTQQLTNAGSGTTVLLLNMEGSDQSQVFTDSSPSNNTLTVVSLTGTLSLSTNVVSAEASTTSRLGLGGDSNKVFVTSDAALNASGSNYVNWRWGSAIYGTSNTSGTITSRVSRSEFGGFSIVTYTGTGANATIGHGLGDAPAMVMVKQRDSSVNGGAVYHRSVATPAGNFLRLFDTTSTNAATADNTVWNGASPTFNSTVFSVGTSVRTNASTGLYVAYCFSEVNGYSRFGSYVGNAAANGTFVWCGFRPKWVLIKSSTAADAWLIYDYQRSLVNVAALNLVPNTNAADATISGIDFVANGFKLRTVITTPNAAQTYVFAAFAESPFKYARAR